MKASIERVACDENQFNENDSPQFPNSALINLSTLVVQVITDFVTERPAVKATFEVENNIIVKGNYAKLKLMLEKIMVNSFSLNVSSQHHSIVFAKSRDELQTYFIMNSELGNTSGTSFGSFGYLDKKELGSEFQAIQSIVAGHNGKFRAIGKKDVGSIFYFSIGA